jgi:hypothetical protein
MSIYDTQIIRLKPGALTVFTKTFPTLPAIIREEDNISNQQIGLFISLILGRPAPLLPKFKGFRTTHACEVICDLYSDTLNLKRCIENIGKPLDAEQAQKLCDIAWFGYFQAVFAGLLCAELSAFIETKNTNKRETEITVRLFPTEQNQRPDYEAYYRTWTMAGVALFSDIGRTFKETLEMVIDGQDYPLNPVITATQSLFRTLNGLYADGVGTFAASEREERQPDEAPKRWYVTRAQGCFLLIKLIVEYITKGIRGLEPIKPPKGLSIAKHKPITQLRKEIIESVETGKIPISIFDLENKAQNLFLEPGEDFTQYQTIFYKTWG